MALPLVASTRTPMAVIQLPATRTAMRIQSYFCRKIRSLTIIIHAGTTRPASPSPGMNK